MTEVWTPIEWFDDYLVSTQGRVKSLKFGKERILKPILSNKGYLRVTLFGPPRHTFNIHSLVLHAFAGPRPKGMECRHLDGNKQNNAISNLAWGTSAENKADQLRHGTSNHGERSVYAKLSAYDVRHLRELYATGLYTQCQLAEVFEVSDSQVARIVLGRQWTLPHHMPRISSNARRELVS